MHFFQPSTLQEKLDGFDPDLPLEVARTIPRTWYGDPEIFAAECEAVFRGTWQLVGCVADLSNVGDATTADIAGQPVIVTRAKDGIVRAMSNVCSHRANVLVEEARTNLPVIMCKYHGWNYDLAGGLRGTPQFDCEGCQYKKDEHGLAQYAVDTWGPYVFVHVGKPKLSLAEHLQPMPQMVADAFDLSNLQFHERREWLLDCNWKVFVDNYMDGGYHVKTVHPELAGVLDYDNYRTDLFAMSALQSSPLKQGSLSAVRSGSVAHYWWMFPNLMFNLYEGYMDMNLVLPISPERCKVIFDFWFAPDCPKKKRKQSVAAAEKVQQQDIDICRRVQRGLGGTSWMNGPYSSLREPGAYLFHQLLARQLRTLAPRELAAQASSSARK